MRGVGRDVLAREAHVVLRLQIAKQPVLAALVHAPSKAVSTQAGRAQALLQSLVRTTPHGAADKHMLQQKRE